MHPLGTGPSAPVVPPQVRHRNLRVNQTTPEIGSSVAELVEALLESSGELAGVADLEAQVARAAAEIDARAALSHCQRLRSQLDQEAHGAEELEALLILGLAHPAALEAQGFALAQEGKRLALRLEQDGKPERAQAILELIAARLPGDRLIDHELASMMRRTGNADRLIDRYMRRAEECVSSGSSKEAISWLQEILLVDSSRRDVARMIRDLRWGDQEKRNRWRSRTRAAIILLGIVAVAALGVQRELSVAERFDAVPAAIPGDLNSLRQRLERIDQLQQEVVFSLRQFDASQEKAMLTADITRLEAKAAQAQVTRRSQREASVAIAESARKQARLYAQQNRFEDAITQFERALAEGPNDWDQRKQVMIDVAAIREWMAVNGDKPIGSRE